MATPADFTTRTRDEMFSIFTAYQALQRRITDLTDEVTALGGAPGIYGADGSKFPSQGDGITQADVVAAFGAITALVGAPSGTQKNAIWKMRR